MVLAVVAVILLGPERLPSLARDLARMLHQLRQLASGARTQLADELGPEFADVDLDALRDLRGLNARAALSRALSVEDDEPAPAPMTEAPPSIPPRRVRWATLTRLRSTPTPPESGRRNIDVLGHLARGCRQRSCRWQDWTACRSRSPRPLTHPGPPGGAGWPLRPAWL